MTHTSAREMASNKHLWDAWAGHSNAYVQHHISALLKGRSTLRDYEVEEMGDVGGKNLLHLQCYVGVDTISWSRLGAHVTGVDYSAKSIDIARTIAETTGSSARFWCSDVYSLPEQTDEKFALIYASRGVVRWLPDLDSWAQVVTHLLVPGGSFYLTDTHPVFTSLEQDGDEARAGRPYFARAEPLPASVQLSPSDGRPAPESHTKYLWPHSMGELVTALCRAGLRIRFLHEFPWADRARPFLREEGRQKWVLKEGELPLYFSLRADLV